MKVKFSDSVTISVNSLSSLFFYVHALARLTGLEEIVLSPGEREKESQDARQDVHRVIHELAGGCSVPLRSL